MALRAKYGFNCQTLNSAGVGQLVPVGYCEVAPGETISGTIKSFARSAPTIQQLDSRMYLDLYVFYCPFRLLWDEWPSFISGQVLTPPVGAVPTVTTLFPQNFEKRFVIPSGYTTNTAWQRYMYFHVVNKFFAVSDNTVANTGTTLFNTANRPSVLERRALTTRLTDSQIPLSGVSPNQTVSVQDLREGLAADAWERMRSFYGDRYVDYLAAVGVRTGWTLVEEAELLCQHHTDWKYRTVAATTDVTDELVLAQTKGYYASSVECAVKGAFIPEHGLLGAYMVARCEPFFQFSAQHPVLGKTDVGQYWNPERSNLRTIDFDGRVFMGATDAGFPGTWTFPLWEEYRVGINMDGQDESVAKTFDDAFAPLVTLADQNSGAEKFRTIPFNALSDSFLSADIIGEADRHFQLTNEWRLARNSPVAKSDIRLKLS